MYIAIQFDFMLIVKSSVVLKPYVFVITVALCFNIFK